MKRRSRKTGSLIKKGDSKYDEKKEFISVVKHDGFATQHLMAK